MSKEKPIASRSEILFCYDARMCNPNGDPDENRPRIDRLTGRNLVTEFRLKRTIRDYLTKQMNKPIFLREEIASDGTRKTIEDLAEAHVKKKSPRNELLKDYIDLRLFGLLFAVKNFHFKQTGPVQFAIGESLHKVEDMQIRMTRVVPTREEAKAGTFGEKSILRYSFITFHGFINDHVAKEVELTEQDVSDMMKAMWFGTTNLSTTSKYGQQSRLLMRIKYNNQYAYVGDLLRRIKLETNLEEKSIQDISQVTLNVSDLFNAVGAKEADIDQIQWASDDDLHCKRDSSVAPFSKLVETWAKSAQMKQTNVLREWT
jgi:CRISPR-associated protein Csh2